MLLLLVPCHRHCFWLFLLLLLLLMPPSTHTRTLLLSPPSPGHLQVMKHGMQSPISSHPYMIVGAKGEEGACTSLFSLVVI